MKNNKPEYIIISIGYYQGQEWEIEQTGIESRTEANEKIESLRSADFDSNSGANGYDAKNGRKFRVMTKSEAIKAFGKNREEWSYR